MKEINNIPEVQAQLMEAFTSRHACKVFDADRKIDEAIFNTILEAARMSPSSFGFEPWQILVIQNDEKRELFRDFAWGANGAASGTAGQLGTASHFCIFLAHTDVNMKAGSDYLQNFMKEVKQLPDDVIELFGQFYKKFQDHDFQIEGARQITDWSARQAYIALGNMMNTAALLGIDSCPIEGFEIEKTQATLEQHFDIDPTVYKPAVMAAFGYRAGNPMFPKSRRSLEQTVSWY
ncbi:NAD(P)H-dependent oxidoreductase [Curvivirga aplysinae]|uniref:NAD(P)H-dependent oxidoreductase n=1 Tax=Curvivirga aplysinae TaxID=2529852 RepID=UPI0012BC8F01|nr:NAD(P)H-dependent oxidoreductase [Curvivirga aplysinae]MTI08671.1 NAD(P)H-dependent oxidoreductase [Curvivirga aplysinae]